MTLRAESEQQQQEQQEQKLLKQNKIRHTAQARERLQHHVNAA